MKKISIILSFLVAAVTCFSQPISQRTNSSFTVQDARWSAQYNMFVPRYADTTAANLQKGIDTLGAIIYTYDVQSFWGRQYSSGKKWVALGSGGGGGSGTVTNIATGLGLSGGPITTTGTLLVDTASASILSRQRAANTYQLLSSDVASQGLLKSGDTTVFAGPFGTPGIFTNDRTLNTNRNIMHWTNGVAAVTGGVNWQFSKQAYSPFQFISADTLVSNDAALSNARPLSGLFARRTMYFNSGVYRQNEMYGHYIGATYNFQDSMVFRTDGGDYNEAVINELRIKPRGTGPQVARTGHAAGGNLSLNQGVAASVSNFYMDGNGVDRLKLNGAGVGHRSYLIMFSGTTDTIENFVYYGPSSFMGGGAKVLKSYILAPSGATSGVNEVDSAFFLYDTARRERSYHAGNLTLGPSSTANWSSDYQLDLRGLSRFSGVADYASNIAANYTSRSFTDKNYVDSALAAFSPTTPGIDDVLAVGQSMTISRSVDLGTHELAFENGSIGINLAGPFQAYRLFTIQNGIDDIDLLHVDVSPNAEHSVIKSVNTANIDGNVAYFESQTTDTYANFENQANFGGGAKVANINGHGDATTSWITYDADTHTFTGTVNLGTAGSSTGIFTQSGVTSGTITFQPAAAAGTYTLTWPTTDGTPSQFLQTDGSGVLSWATVSGGGDVLKVGTPVNNQLGVWTGDGTIEGDANLTFASSTLTIGVAGASLGSLVLSGNTSGAATITVPATVTSYSFILPSTNGTANQVLGMTNAATGQEYKTMAVGTSGTDFAVAFAANSITFNLPDASASNRGVITTGTQTIAGAKTFSATTALAGVTASGFATLSSGIATNSTAGNSNFYATGGITANRTTVASLLPLSAAGIGGRVMVNGTTAYSMTASDAFGTLVIGATGGVTEAASGTHPIIAGLVVRPITVTNGSGATDILAGVYIEGPPTGVTPATGTYGLWVDAGTSRLDGSLLQGQGADVASANNLVLGNDGNTFEITGTTQINLISNLGFQNGTVIRLMFTSTPTVKNGQATSTTNITLLLAGAADFSATANDILTLQLGEIGGTQAWREISRSVN